MYTNQVNIEGKLGRALTSDEVTYFNTVLGPAVDAYINQQTNTKFGSTDVVQVYVNGSDGSMIVIPTMHEISEVAALNEGDYSYTAIPVDDYRLFPQGDDTYAITHLGGSWDDGLENYRITGKLGYTYIPIDITNIATELATFTYAPVASGIKSERTGDWSITYSDAIDGVSSTSMSTLHSYRRLSRSI